MVLEALPDSGKVACHLDAECRQLGRRSDARQHQKLRRRDGAHRQDHRPCSSDGPRRAAAPADDGAGRPAVLDDEAERRAVGHEAEIAPTRCRPEKGIGRIDAPPIMDIDVVNAEPGLPRAIEIIVAAEAALAGRREECIVERPVIPRPARLERSLGGMERTIAAPAAFRLLEIGQHLAERPAGETRRGPAVIVAGIAANVDHAVDRRRPAEAAAARPVDAPPAEPRLRLGAVHPVMPRPAEHIAIGTGHRHQQAVAAAARFDQHDRGGAVGAQPVGQHRAGRPGTENEVVATRAHRGPTVTFRHLRQ